MSRILPRYNRTELAKADSAKIARIVGQSDAADHNKPAPRATAPGDHRRLRGIPIAGGASGTSPGTDPLHALLNKYSYNET